MGVRPPLQNVTVSNQCPTTRHQCKRCGINVSCVPCTGAAPPRLRAHTSLAVKQANTRPILIFFRSFITKKNRRSTPPLRLCQGCSAYGQFPPGHIVLSGRRMYLFPAYTKICLLVCTVLQHTFVLSVADKGFFQSGQKPTAQGQ